MNFFMTNTFKSFLKIDKHNQKKENDNPLISFTSMENTFNPILKNDITTSAREIFSIIVAAQISC